MKPKTHKPKLIQKSIYFKPGQLLRLRARTEQAAKGLLRLGARSECTVSALESGRGGPEAGWDVYEGIDTATGKEVGFYGFDVIARG